jgi:UDP-N-acetylglucosamine transferase subunit ALG13
VSLVFVMVGTDHHPFPRLVDWVDEAARRHPDVRFVVQHGDSAAPSVAEGSAFLPHEEIRALLAQASAAVVHGGPGTIMDARGAGHVPICVPRDPALGEHVDGHQQRFAALVHAAGVVTRVETAQEFQDTLDSVLAARVEGRAISVPTSAATEEARANLANELDELMLLKVRGSWWGRRGRAAGRLREA